jgi:hypothetical protein
LEFFGRIRGYVLEKYSTHELLEFGTCDLHVFRYQFGTLYISPLGKILHSRGCPYAVFGSLNESHGFGDPMNPMKYPPPILVPTGRHEYVCVSVVLHELANCPLK